MENWDERDEGKSRYAWLTKGCEWTGANDTSGTSYASDFHSATCEQLGLSGTNFEEVVFAAIAEVLQFLLPHSADVGDRCTLHDTRGDQRARLCLAAELADRGAFIECGTSLRTAWVTDAGKAWLRDYQTHGGGTHG